MMGNVFEDRLVPARGPLLILPTGDVWGRGGGSKRNNNAILEKLAWRCPLNIYTGKQRGRQIDRETGKKTVTGIQYYKVYIKIGKIWCVYIISLL